MFPPSLLITPSFSISKSLISSKKFGWASLERRGTNLLQTAFAESL